MCLSAQPALKVRLAASSKRDGAEWAWVVNAAPAAAAVWDERTCEVAGDAAQNTRKARPAQPSLRMSSAFLNAAAPLRTRKVVV